MSKGWGLSSDGPPPRQRDFERRDLFLVRSANRRRMVRAACWKPVGQSCASWQMVHAAIGVPVYEAIRVCLKIKEHPNIFLLNQPQRRAPRLKKRHTSIVSERGTRRPKGGGPPSCAAFQLTGRTSKVGRILQGQDVSNLPGAGSLALGRGRLLE